MTSQRNTRKRQPARTPHWSTLPTARARFEARLIADSGEQLNRQLVHHWPRDPLLDYPADFHTPAELSTQQRNVLVMTAFGRTTQQIADMLHIAPATVYMHLHITGRKLDAGSMSIAVARRIIGLPPRTPPQGARRERPCAECRYREMVRRSNEQTEAALRRYVTEIIEGKFDPKELTAQEARCVVDAIEIRLPAFADSRDDFFRKRERNKSPRRRVHATNERADSRPHGTAGETEPAHETDSISRSDAVVIAPLRKSLAHG
jgi:DNA-binding CsgD family transcriptional regulator